MPIRVKITTTPTELNDLFETRYRVFVEEEKYLNTGIDGRIFDRFDAFPTTVNIVAMVNRKVVGGLRLTEWSNGGTSADDLFDFRSYLPNEADRIVTASMLCLEREYRKLLRLCFMMFSMGIYWAISKRIDCVVAAINPLVEPLLKRIGFKRIDSPFYDQYHGIDVLPMRMDMAEADPLFLKMAEFQGFHGSLRTFDRELYRAGEKIIEGDTLNDAAYVVVDGQVTISRPGRRTGDQAVNILAQLGPHEIFGEVALLTDKPRNADAIALTDVDLMVIERDVFWEQMKSNPELQLKLIKLFGNRLAEIYEQLPRRSSKMASN